MDAASQALAQSLPTHVRRTYTALAECSDVPVSRTTVWYRDKGRPSRLTKAQSQQYLTPQKRKLSFDMYCARLLSGSLYVSRTSLS